MSLSLVVAGGTVLDGTGCAGRPADVLVEGDRIVGVGAAPHEHSAAVLDATGLAVVPGFINILSHAWGSIQLDGSAASDLLQGVTTEVFGEATSPGPAGAEYAAYLRQDYGHQVAADFPRLSDGLDHIVGGGISPNVASFVGGDNLRHLGAGFANRSLSPAESDMVVAALAEEMQEGALGLGTALIYPPGRFADTQELSRLCAVVAAHDGLYASHLRSEGDRFLASLDELLALNEQTGVRAEVYHLKALGRANWPKMEMAVAKISAARSSGRDIGANMYPYEAGSNHLASCIPPHFQEGGPEALARRLSDPLERAEIRQVLREGRSDFEDLLRAAGGGEGVLLLRDLADGTATRGRRLSALADDWSMDEIDTLLEVTARDPWAPAAYFFIDPENIRLGLRQEWVCVGSDGTAHPATPPWTDDATHPRTYGTFARVLGRYTREDPLFSFEEAVRRLTSLPADRLRLRHRGRVRPGCYADLVVLDPATVADTATWADPHQYATGIRDVIVNGSLVVANGRVTQARPGRRLRRAAS